MGESEYFNDQLKGIAAVIPYITDSSGFAGRIAFACHNGKDIQLGSLNPYVIAGEDPLRAELFLDSNFTVSILLKEVCHNPTDTNFSISDISLPITSDNIQWWSDANGDIPILDPNTLFVHSLIWMQRCVASGNSISLKDIWELVRLFDKIDTGAEILFQKMTGEDLFDAYAWLASLPVDQPQYVAR